MTSLSAEIFENFQVRKSKKQKNAFIELIQNRIPEAKVEKKGSARNIVIGDPDSAKVIFTAHYDTCAVMPLPNFITPKNILIYIIYQLFLVAIIFAIAIGCGLAAGLLISPALGSLVGFTVYFLLFYLIMAGPANPHTANDNTSGVITLCEIYEAMSEDQRKNCAFVFFDLEEQGLIGSSAFWRAHKKEVNDTLLVNFDCVSDGDNILLVSSKKALAEYGEALESSFLPRGDKKLLFEKRASAFYPSDQSRFPCGVGVAALRKAKFIGYYMNRIHTPRDTVFDENNIELLRSGAITLSNRLSNKE